MIDSPDIPLNVSRSYLQSDANVKKISGYISKKVSDRLKSIFTQDRKDFENKWDDLKIFIHYGMLTEDDFYDRAKQFALLKDTEGKYFTFEEYQTLIKDAQTDKEGNLIYLYANDKDEQYSYIEEANNKGYNVLLLDGQLDVAVIGLLERKLDKSRFTRVDANVIDRLIVKDEDKKEELDLEKKELLNTVFTGQLPQNEKVNYNVEAQALGENQAPVIITQSEYMRRMKDMAKIQAGMAFYGEMPDMFNLVLNTDHRLVKAVLADSEKAIGDQLNSFDAEIRGLNARKDAINQMNKDKKYDEITQESKDELSKVEADIKAQREQRKDTILKATADNKVVKQLIDLALLQNGLLKGEALNDFVKRSVELIK